MADLRAHFAADFTKFNDAVKQAEVTLRGLETNSYKVGESLDRMGDRFSGRKLIQEATLMAEAIEKIGGTGVLTKKELESVGAKATEAIEKMRKLGLDVPDSLTKITKAIEPIPKQLTLMDRAAGALKSSFGQMFSAFTAATLVDRAVSSLINFGKAAIDDAGHLVDLADKTGLSINALQEMSYAAEQTGGSVDAMADATFKLGVNLAKGTDAVRDAADDLGLPFEKLRAMKPEEQFRTIATALGKMEDANERNRLGVELFGRSFAGVAAAVVAGYDDLAQAAPKATEESVRALDEYADAWERLKTKMGKAVLEIAGRTARFFEWADQKAYDAADYLRGLVGAAPLVRPSAEPKPETAAATQAATRAANDYVDAIRNAQLEVSKLTRAERAQIDSALKLGVSQKDIAEQYDVSEGALRLYVEQQRQSVALSKQQTDEERRKQEKLDEERKAREAYIADVADDLNLLRARNEALGGYVLALDKIPPALEKIPAPKDFQLPAWDMKTSYGAGQAQEGFFGAFQQYAEHVSDLMAPPGKAAGTAFSRAFTSSLASLGPNILSAITGGGSISKTIGSSLGLGITENLFGAGGSLTKGLTSGLSKTFGKTIGGALSGILPGIGALAGPAIEGVTKLFGKMFGGEGKATNKQRDEWIKANFGTSDNLRKLATEAGVADSELRKLFSVSKVKDFEAAAAAVQAKLGSFTAEQEADAARLEAAIQKYGFSLEQLGPKLQQSKLDEQAKELIEDWRVLVDAGIDVATVNEEMAETINEYLQNAIKLGTEVPRAMKPILERMAQQGTLTDSAGNKIEDLEALGLQYSETMTQGFDRIVTKLDELINRLLGAGDAVNAIPDDKVIDVTVRYHEENRPENLSEDVSRPFESYLHEPNLPGFQHGTRGRYLDFGEGTPVMLHGRERVVTEDEQTVASAQMTTMVNAVAALQVSLVRALRENALQVRDQTQLALARA